MTAKEFLLRARRLQARIDQLEDAKKDVWEKSTYAADTGAASQRPAAVKRRTEAYGAYVDKIDAERARLLRMKLEILEVIGQLQDNTLAALLTAYYINGKTWEQTAVEIHYSYFRTVHDKHPQALVAVEELLKKK